MAINMTPYAVVIQVDGESTRVEVCSNMNDAFKVANREFVLIGNYNHYPIWHFNDYDLDTALRYTRGIDPADRLFKITVRKIVD